MFVTDQRLLFSKLVRLRIYPCKISWTQPKASLVLSTYVSNCHPHSTLSSCQPLIEGVKVTHMWKTARNGRLHLSNHSPANSPSLPSCSLRCWPWLPPTKRLDQTPVVKKIEQNIAQNSGLSTTWTAAMLLLEPQTDSSALASNCQTNLSCFFKILENMN